MKSPIQLFIAIAILLATATVAAQVYKWVDKDGRVQYSDQPPPADAKEVKSAPKRLTPPPATASAANATTAAAPAKAPAKDGKDGKDAKAAPGKEPPPAPPKNLAEANKQSADRRKAEDDAAKKAEDDARIAKANQERCDSAKRYLADLDSGRPIATSNAAGEREVMTDEARAREVNRARDAMNQSCKK
jgi:hypothetical protein